MLLQKGYTVIGGSPRRSSTNLWRLEELSIMQDNHPVDNFELINLDVTCSAQVNRVMQKYEPDEVYNLAAQSFVPESFASPTSTFNINALGVLHFLESIRRSFPETRFYQASTSEMFGLHNVEYQDENTPFHPRSPYAVAKAAAHYAVQNYREAYNLHASCGILFNHESPLRGEEFVTRKVSKAVARIVTEKQERLLIGNTEARRDWGHAIDYVYGMWLMLQQDAPDDYVLATGETHSVRRMIELAFEHVGLDCDSYIEYDARFMRPSEVPVLCGNPEKAREKLGWQPSHTFTNLITEMVDYDLDREGVDPILLRAEVDQTFNTL
jgi:GDPmannose 4,6-dehydratase